MKPYQTRKLIEGPDVADIQAEGRHSSVGRLPGKSGDYRPYCRGANRKTIRRQLKRADKSKAMRISND
jgi:hypothetical protein